MNVPNLKQNFHVTYVLNGNAVICYVHPEYAERLIHRDICYPYRDKQYKGIAVMKPGDKYDIQLAKRIAKSKAIRSYYKTVRRFAKSSLKKELNTCIEKFEYLKKIDNKINQITDNIIKLAYNKEDE